jgi:hypothetical protein
MTLRGTFHTFTISINMNLFYWHFSRLHGPTGASPSLVPPVAPLLPASPNPISLTTVVPAPISAFQGVPPAIPGNVSTRRTTSAATVHVKQQNKKPKPRRGFPESTVTHGFGGVANPIVTSVCISVLFWCHCVSHLLFYIFLCCANRSTSIGR